jgi:hypothetical protein
MRTRSTLLLLVVACCGGPPGATPPANPAPRAKPAAPPPVFVVGGAISSEPKVTVMGEDGAPIADAHVQLDGWTGDWERTGNDGIARFHGVDVTKPHTLIVAAQNRGLFSPQTLPEWRPADTSVRMPTAHDVVVHAVDASGRPAAKAWIVVRRESGVTGTTADGHGDVRLHEFRGGETFELVAVRDRPEFHRGNDWTADLVGWTSTSVDGRDVTVVVR